MCVWKCWSSVTQKNEKRRGGERDQICAHCCLEQRGGEHWGVTRRDHRTMDTRERVTDSLKEEEKKRGERKRDWELQKSSTESFSHTHSALAQISQRDKTRGLHSGWKTWKSPLTLCHFYKVTSDNGTIRELRDGSKTHRNAWEAATWPWFFWKARILVNGGFYRERKKTNEQSL